MSGLTYEQQKRAIELGWSVWPEGVPVTDVTKLPDRVKIAGDNPLAQQQTLAQLSAEKAHLDEQIARLNTRIGASVAPTPESIFADLAQREQGASTGGADNAGAGGGDVVAQPAPVVISNRNKA